MIADMLRLPRGSHYWKARERRESGEDKCEFEELLKLDWQEFDVSDQATRVSYDSVRGARGKLTRSGG